MPVQRGVQQLELAARRREVLEVLHLTHDRLSGEAVGTLMAACEQRGIRLRKLFLKSNAIMELGASSIAEKFGVLEELDIRSNKVSA